jgi:hypothetical protein
MAYREVAMFEIKVVLERVGRGESRSEVERATGHTRKTIGRYVKRAEKLGWRPGMVVTDELAGAVARANGVARERGPGESELLLMPHLERVRAWLTPSPSEKRGLRLAKVQQLLAREGVRVPYSSLHRFAVTHCGFSDRRRITVRLDDPPPGLYAQVDFGRLGLVPDGEGRRRLLWGLSVVLPCSRHQFLFVTFSQRLEDLIGGLEDAWGFFGGVASLVITDYVPRHIIGLLCPPSLCGGGVWRRVLVGRRALGWAHKVQRLWSQARRSSSSRQVGFRGVVSEVVGGRQASRAASLVRVLISA